MRNEDAIAMAGDGRPVLIAGPTASGKSALALAIAQTHGGTIVNADALQVYARWRILTARPDDREQTRAPHALYGHVAADRDYSVGHWLRDLASLPAGSRPIIVGGTGLYLTALTEGLADIPPTPPDIRTRADALDMASLLADLDPATRDRIDTANRARVQRAYEVQHTTGRGLAAWQNDTPPPPLMPPGTCHRFVIDAPPDALNPRIDRRFDAMLTTGALDEVRAALPDYDPVRPANRAIGAPELAAHLRGQTTLADAREAAIVATRQYAKRQRTWFRKRMKDWHRLPL